MQSLLKYQHTLLDADEFHRLIILAQSGDIAARNTIIEHNIKLVLKNAFIVQRRLNIEMEDLIQFGIIGMIRAIEKYDSTKINAESGKPYAFSTYATWWIRQSMERETAMHNQFIRLPIHVVRKFAQFRSVISYMVATGVPLNDVTIDAHVADYKFSKDELTAFKQTPIPICEVRETNNDSFSIYENTVDQNSDIAEAFSNADLLEKLIQACRDTLTPREYDLIVMRFGLTGKDVLTLEEVGDIMGITRERVRQLQVAAMRKLKVKLTRDFGEDYVETAFG
jgi:RNA polymerase nonessential primary-like sigma factor